SAAYWNWTGNSNTFLGTLAGVSNNSGSYNVMVGDSAGTGNLSGNGNTLVGYQSDVTTGNLNNATAIGNGAVVNADNKIRLGNSSVTVIEGQVAYTFPSDGRFKTNIRESVKGLDFIMKLRPIVYNFQSKKYDEFIKRASNNDLKFASFIDYSESEKMI